MPGYPGGSTLLLEGMTRRPSSCGYSNCPYAPVPDVLGGTHFHLCCSSTGTSPTLHCPCNLPEDDPNAPFQPSMICGHGLQHFMVCMLLHPLLCPPLPPPRASLPGCPHLPSAPLHSCTCSLASCARLSGRLDPSTRGHDLPTKQLWLQQLPLCTSA